jgi:peptidyl-prolyl cis-trans isomerase D
VEAVRFPAASYTASVIPTEDQVRELYDSNPARFPRPAAPKAAPQPKPDPAADYAAVRPEVRAALVLQMAQQAAVKAASDLAFSIYDGKVTRDGIDSFLAAHKVKAETLAPFSADEEPKELPGATGAAKAAFELGADQFYSEAVPTPAGAVVLIWKSSIPSRQPLLAEVSGKVRTDAADNMKRLRFVEFGRTLRSAVERRVKAGETFDKAVAESAGGVKVDVKSLPPFSLKAPPRDLDPVAEQALEGLGKGQVSPMESNADEGVLVYAANEKAPATDDSNPLYGTVRSSLAARYAAADETSIMREYVDDELKKAGLITDKGLPESP